MRAGDVDCSVVARYKAWAHRFGLTPSRREACPCSLLRLRCCQYGRGLSGYSGVPSHECLELCDPHSSVTEWDHQRLWNRHGRPIIAVTELYGPDMRADDVAGRFAGRLPEDRFTVIRASKDGAHSNWNPGACTPVILLSNRHREADRLTRALLKSDPKARIVSVGGQS